jgi:hypothetical protein
VPEAQRITAHFIQELSRSGILLGICVGGAGTNTGGDTLSDVDVFTVVEDGALLRLDETIQKIAGSDPRVCWSIFGQEYPWFGRLATLFWRDPFLFTLDIGAVEEKNADSFFVEPDAIVLMDTTGVLTRRRAESRSRLSTERETLLLTGIDDFIKTLIKLRKALLRGHLWNALFYVTLLRRALILFLRIELSLGWDQPLLGKADRDIEDHAPAELLMEIAKLTAGYSAGEVIAVTHRIIDHTLALGCVVQRAEAAGLIRELRAGLSDTATPPGRPL